MTFTIRVTRGRQYLLLAVKFLQRIRAIGRQLFTAVFRHCDFRDAQFLRWQIL
jgi:hypothetical protein